MSDKMREAFEKYRNVNPIEHELTMDYVFDACQHFHSQGVKEGLEEAKREIQSISKFCLETKLKHNENLDAPKWVRYCAQQIQKLIDEAE